MIINQQLRQRLKTRPLAAAQALKFYAIAENVRSQIATEWLLDVNAEGLPLKGIHLLI
jgi:hypothetical protein